MCGRYANHVGAMYGWTDILTDWPTETQLGFNLAPTQMIPAFLPYGGTAMRWGLIPSWLEQTSTGFSTFNARLDSVAEKPAFRHAWANSQRCLIPALGYYEWQMNENSKQPYFVCPVGTGPLVFAGIYEPSNDNNPASCSILTRPSQGTLKPLHKSMPVMLNPEHAECWFYGTEQDAMTIAWRDYTEEFRFYAVSKRVNNVKNQGEDLVRPYVIEEKVQRGFDF